MNSTLVGYMLMLLPFAVLGHDLGPEFQLEFSQVDSCSKPTLDFSTTSEVTEHRGMFRAELDIVVNCAEKIGNPRLHVSSYGITLSADAVSESGMYTACKCRRRVEYTFTFPEYKEYGIKRAFFVINGAVVDQLEILNNQLNGDAASGTR